MEILDKILTVNYRIKSVELIRLLIMKSLKASFFILDRRYATALMGAVLIAIRARDHDFRGKYIGYLTGLIIRYPFPRSRGTSTSEARQLFARSPMKPGFNPLQKPRFHGVRGVGVYFFLFISKNKKKTSNLPSLTQQPSTHISCFLRHFHALFTAF